VPAVRTVSQADIEAVPPGGTLRVEEDALITPLAEEEARRRQVTIVRGGGGDETLVAQVSERVLARLGAQASPEVVAAVVGEVARALDGAGPELVRVGPNIDYCQMCLEQERARSRSRAVITTTGRNQKGIVAAMTAGLAELGGDILDISQTLVGDFFTMIIVVDTGALSVPFAEFKQRIEDEAHRRGLGCMMMHEDVLNSLHRV
jgi:ACT domain-containing protein